MTSNVIPPPTTLHTQELLSQAQSGSQAAWEELYRRYRALLT